MNTQESPAGIESPCTQVCTMDAASGLCRGCARSLEEIATWVQLSAEARRAIMAELPRRRARLTKQSGTR